MKDYLEIGILAIPLILLVFSLFFTVGIIWRAEMKLDFIYKIFFVALIFIFLATLSDTFVKNKFFIVADRLLHLFFSIFLLISTWMMRNLMRDIDGEKK
ncbi:MAG: hypothetical protein RBS77_00960 [Candidatus Moranbacteria bacterium]|jgi:hypothetical protein|nr:hypothetical protein [Candidatus Moranbacteria bacterium]